MTYNFRNDKRTETDYGILFSVMERMYGNGEKLFTDEKAYNKYANQWKTKLESLDTNFIFEEVKNEREIFLKDNGYEAELYYCELYFDKFYFSVNMDVEKILMDLKNTKFLTGKLNLNTLANYGILNVPAEFNIPTVMIKDTPIIITEFISGDYLYLIIDGNHRIKYWKKNNIEEVEYLFLKQEDMVRNNYFVSELDKYLYLLNNELLNLMELRMRGFSEIRLLNNSFIRTDQILKIENLYDKVTGEPIKEKKSFLKAIANSIANR